MRLSDVKLSDERCREAFSQLVANGFDGAETWRYVVTPDFITEDYLVSDFGRVLSLPRYRTYGRDERSGVVHRKFHPGGLRKPGRQPSGHQTMSITHNKIHFRTHVHRLVAWAFLGPQPAGHHVRHLDGDPSNNRLDNLVYESPWENSADSIGRVGKPGTRIVIQPALEQRLIAAIEGQAEPRAILREILALLEQSKLQPSTSTRQSR